MNNKLSSIHAHFPFFILGPLNGPAGPFYMVSPEGHFEDPNDSIMVSVWGEQFKFEVSGPGEYHEEIFDTPEEVIQTISNWLPATETE